MVTFLGLPAMLYTLSPVLSVGSLQASDLHGNNGVKTSITVTGMGIRDVSVQCATNKVIFENKNTLALPNFTLINEYAVGVVGRGESFTADCNFAWSLWTNSTDGIFLMGAGLEGKPQLAMPIFFRDGLPYPAPSPSIPSLMTPNLTGYSSAQVTAIDGEFIVLYKWPFCPFQQTRIIHLIAERNDSDLKWRPAPGSEPIIPNATGGYVFTASGNGGKWGVTMNRGTPP